MTSLSSRALLAFPAAALVAFCFYAPAQTPEPALAPSETPDSVAASPDFFEAKIRPVLATSCYPCHTQSALGGLRLDSREAMLRGGGRGAAITPGDPETSWLIRAVRQSDPGLKMPAGSPKLSDVQIDDLSAWVKAGAVWPGAPAAAVGAATPTKAGEKY